MAVVDEALAGTRADIRDHGAVHSANNRATRQSVRTRVTCNGCTQLVSHRQ
jgi:hypothetical protein